MSVNKAVLEHGHGALLTPRLEGARERDTICVWRYYLSAQGSAAWCSVTCAGIRVPTRRVRAGKLLDSWCSEGQWSVNPLVTVHTLSDSVRPTDCVAPPGSSGRGVLQARILEWVAITAPGGLPDPGSEPRLPHLLRWKVDA